MDKSLKEMLKFFSEVSLKLLVSHCMNLYFCNVIRLLNVLAI